MALLFEQMGSNSGVYAAAQADYYALFSLGHGVIIGFIVVLGSGGFDSGAGRSLIDSFGRLHGECWATLGTLNESNPL